MLLLKSSVCLVVPFLEICPLWLILSSSLCSHLSFHHSMFRYGFIFIYLFRAEVSCIWGSVLDHFWGTLGRYHLEHWLHSLQSLPLIGCMLDLLTCPPRPASLSYFVHFSLCFILGNFFPALLQFTDSSFSCFTLLFNHLFGLFQC